MVFKTKNKKTNPCTACGEPTRWVLCVIDYLPCPPSAACPRCSHHHVSLSLLIAPTVQLFILSPFSFHSQSTPFGPHLLCPLFIMCTLHVVPISSHYTSERASGLLSRSSVMNVSVNCTCTHIPAGYSQHHPEAACTLIKLNKNISTFRKAFHKKTFGLMVLSMFTHYFPVTTLQGKAITFLLQSVFCVIFIIMF